MSKNLKSKALKLILLFGIVSLFGDIVYEGARSINGQYLQMLGASAFVVGLIAGLGEFFGYGLRLFSGYFSDKTKAYWFFTILGYSLLASVPLLALSNFWQLAAFLIIIERIGKAIRNPARDALMSQAAKKVGTGWGFAVHEFLDQIGALLGPILIAFILGLSFTSKTIAEYQHAYSLLWLPFVFLMVFLVAAYFLSKNQKFEKKVRKERGKLSIIFWYYLLFTFSTTFGFLNFVFLGYHFKAAKILPDLQIPLLYAGAMIADAFFALFVGKIYDVLKTKKKNKKAGLFMLITIPLLSLIIPLLVFSSSFYVVLIGILVWGAVLGAHETIMRAAIADITPVNRRGTAYGIFNAAYGFSAFLGSSILGFLYEHVFCWLATFVVLVQVIAIVIFAFIQLKLRE
ncbi:MAG: MFS transporter [Candidatus Aenigmatarchaeota archaeon]